MTIWNVSPPYLCSPQTRYIPFDLERTIAHGAQKRTQRNGQVGKRSRLQCMPPFTQKVMDTVKAAVTYNV